MGHNGINTNAEAEPSFDNTYPNPYEPMRKFGLVSSMMNSKDIFFFKFISNTGMESMLENGPWWIRNVPLILRKWSLANVSKEELKSVPVWVKLHDVPIMTFTEDGLIAIVTKLGTTLISRGTKIVTLDSFDILNMVGKFVEVAPNDLVNSVGDDVNIENSKDVNLDNKDNDGENDVEEDDNETTSFMASKSSTRISSLNSGAGIERKKEEDEVESLHEIERKIVESSVDKVEVDIHQKNDNPARKPVKYAEMYRTQRPKGNQRNWNNLKSHQLGSNFVMYNKACYTCRSFNHLQARCKYHQRDMMVNGTNHSRVNHSANTVPKAVLTRTGLKPVKSVRPVNPKRSFQRRKSYNNRNFFQKVNTAKGKVNTVRLNSAVLNAVRANKSKAGHSHKQLEDQGYFNSGHSRHITGNISYLTDFKEFDGGNVAFGGGAKGGKVTGKRIIRTGKLDFEDVYFVKELKFNFFSVSQMCAKKNNVLFTDTECFVLSPDFKLADESHVLIKVPRNNNMYSVDMKNIIPTKDLTYLVANATNDESMLWHGRLGHINFKIINKLVKENLVRDGDNKGNDGPCKESEIDNQERPNVENNTKDVNTVGPSINTASLNINTASPTVNTVRQSDNFFGADTDMRSLDVVEVDISKISTIYHVPTTPNTRIHKDHSLDNVIGDIQSGVQTRRMIVTTDEQGFISAIYEEKTHEDLHTCLWTLRVLFCMDGLKKRFMFQPPGFENPDYPDKVYKVEKALYGKIDQTLFIKRQKDDILLVQVYVDDIIFGSTKKELCTEFEKLMHEKFQMSLMGELTFFLGLQVKQKSDRIFISQDKYVDEILSKFKYTDVKPASTSMDKEKALLKNSDGDDVDVHLYRRSTINMIEFNIGQEDDKVCSSQMARPERLSNLPTELPLGEGNTSHSEEGSMQLLELMNICIKLSGKSKEVREKLKHKRRKAIVDSLEDEEASLDKENSPKQRMMIEEINEDENTNLVKSSKQREAHETAGHRKESDDTEVVDLSTTSPQKDDDEETLAEILVSIKKSATKDKGKAIMQESEPSKKIKKKEMIQISLVEKIAQRFYEKEQAQLLMDKEYAQQVQAQWVSDEARIAQENIAQAEQ
nr:ribonuclease H-like domain-containing protein [Tanacetum cinerariifolium]